MLFGSYTNLTEDPAKFAVWKPKIEAYQFKLESGIKQEYMLPQDLLPLQEELDSGLHVLRYADKIMTEEEIAITEKSGSELVEEIASGSVSAVTVFKAYAKTATVAHQLTNCAMELFLDEGLERAKELDNIFSKTGKTVGPLHGLPVSLKEHYAFKGKVTHAGFVGKIDHMTDFYAKTVEDLYKAGAVFYIRTTEPQLLMHLCSRNNIIGKCRNPCNTALSPCGSSSGEGAIAAMRGSVFGLGSDIGGSIRGPAAICGVWGLRPTLKRISNLGVMSSFDDSSPDMVYPTLGPLGRSADDIYLFMKALMDAKPWEADPLVVPLPWKECAEPKPRDLKIAICYDDGIVKPTAPVIRGLKAAKEKLEKAGVQVVEWKPLNVLELVKACYAGYNYDLNKAHKNRLSVSGEPVLELSQKFLTFGSGDEVLTGEEVARLCHVRDEGRIKYMDAMNDESIDFILTPTYVSPAVKPESTTYWGYTCLWNILDFPNIVFPTGLTVLLEDKVDETYKPRSELEKYERGLYTGPEDSKNAPIGLQLTGRRYRDEELVKASKVLADIIQKS